MCFLMYTGELLHILSLIKPVAVFCSPLTSYKIKQMYSKFSYIREVIIYDHIEPIIDSRRIYSYKSILESGDPNSFDIPAGDFSEDVVVVLTSSGTTGLPKGVMLTHSNLITLVEIIRCVFTFFSYFYYKKAFFSNIFFTCFDWTQHS